MTRLKILVMTLFLITPVLITPNISVADSVQGYMLLHGLSTPQLKNCPNRPPDGCSTPENIHIPGKWGGDAQSNFYYWNDRFQGSCNNHDRCYQTKGNDKITCDAFMWAQMAINDCKSGLDGVCMGVAGIYYGVLLAHPTAKDSYDNAQRDGC